MKVSPLTVSNAELGDLELRDVRDAVVGDILDVEELARVRCHTERPSADSEEAAVEVDLVLLELVLANPHKRCTGWTDVRQSRRAWATLLDGRGERSSREGADDGCDHRDGRHLD